MKIDKITPYIAMGLACAGVTFGLCYAFMGSAGTNSDDFAIIDECREIIAENGNPDFDDESAVAGAINGYLQGGGDKYTFYYPHYNADPVEDNKSYINSSGTALASGFQVDISDDGNILLTEVTNGFAAYKSGLRTGDIITHIDGVSISEQGFENYANKILGKQDTEVQLTVNRDGEMFELTFKRDHEYIRDIEWKMLGDTAYIRILKFGTYSAGNMSTAMSKIGDAENFIIDLRNNGGGMGDYMIQAVDYFAGEGSVNYYNSKGEQTDAEYTNEDCLDVPVVILINEKTASAAESFTALCKQFGKNVTLVGTNTFGKGIFQQEADLSNGGKLHYTAGYFTVGDWECWQGVGIAPDIEVEMDNALIGTEDDVQLAKALEILE